jgi:hypothetical protein
MQQSEAFQRQLRAHYAAIVEDTFARARHCLNLARAAQQAGDCAEVRKWMWRNRAQSIAMVLVCLASLLHGCGKTPARVIPSQEFTANFEVQPSQDGQSIVWSLQFKTREQYHAFLETTADGADRAKVRELIAAGMRLHHIVGCSAHEDIATKLGDDGIAFVGSCSLGAHAAPAGGI